ncbi:uncharacterized protein LOC129172974 [Dunckerocampus dactyliophorus]|uniref:uncharacterized protein LOC129172974 n=1 Tax=Dunckerocampus dactyliophorus TaxID=161453 RepID=UPI0024053CA5|nr:uncharacterized protein LOC129172974 [Dunckerocampus dactyliophorus]
MACGIHLGFLLICLVQAEHVRCLWTPQKAERQRDNAYVGYLQQRLTPRLGGSNPQNEFRQALSGPASAQSSNRNKGLAMNVYEKLAQESAQNGYGSVKVVRVRPVSRQSAPLVPKKSPELDPSASIASAGTLKQHESQQANKKSWAPQQGTRRMSLLPKKYVTAQSPAAKPQQEKRYQPVARKQQSSLFVSGYGSREYVSNMQTSATGVASTSNSAGSSQQGKVFPSYSQSSHKHYVPLGYRRNSQQSAPTDVLRIPQRFGGHPIKRLKTPETQVLNEKTQKASLQKKLSYRLPARKGQIMSEME